MTIATPNKYKPSWLPFLLLLLTLSTTFFFGNDRGHFYRPGHHDATTSVYMAIVANLSPEHDLFRFISRSLDANGLPAYDLYHRFPIAGYLLIKLATLPFSDDPSAQLHAARILILSFFVAAAVLAYLSLYRLASDEWIALVAVLLSFSSFYLLYYNDMIATEGMIDLFGVMLVFHGMVVFVQDGRFRQLLAKACIALLLGWHVFALLLPFIILTLGSEFVHQTNTRDVGGKHLLLSMLRSRSLTLGAVSLLFGTSVLAFNFITEYIALNGETPLTQLSTWNSMLRRTGQTTTYSEFSHALSWGPYLKEQFSRIGGMVYPYYLLNQVFSVQNHWSVPNLSVLGIVVFASCLIGLIFARHKILLATLLASGFFWMLPMRHNAHFHDFESIFYIGIPLVFFAFCALGFLWTCKLFDNRTVIVPGRFFSTIFAVFVFVLSSSHMSRAGYSVEESIFHEKLSDDFNVVRKIMKNRTVVVRQELHDELRNHSYLFDTGITSAIVPYYLSGNAILGEGERDFWDRAEFLLKSEHEKTSKALLTPENEFVFLYDKTIHDRERKWLAKYSETTAAGDPEIHSRFDVYYRHNKNNLVYIKKPCFLEDIKGIFFIHFAGTLENIHDHPHEEDDPRIIYFQFEDKGMKYGEKCIAEVALPEENTNYLRTGQYNDSDRVWSDGFNVEMSLYESEYLPVLDGNPVIRSTFDLYIDGNMLYYVKDSCPSDDVVSEFFINVYPVHERDLPEKRHDFETIVFDFSEIGIKIDERCLMRIVLPEYVIDHIRTGQRTEHGNVLWESIYYFNADDKHGMLLASDEPKISSAFDVYHLKNTMVYIKEPCTPFDTKAKFNLRIDPLDRIDLPHGRRNHGFDNLDFYFESYRDLHFVDEGEYFDKKCLISVMLPEYKIASIQTGQFTTHRGEDGNKYYNKIWGGRFLIRHR